MKTRRPAPCLNLPFNASFCKLFWGKVESEENSPMDKIEFTPKDSFVAEVVKDTDKEQRHEASAS
ncbi:MAG: hypothetical protein HWE10_01240 [Gammaproteobacteria bacterium]|nr:hypothetical protein [Gammaproteobacteria bacterium]